MHYVIQANVKINTTLTRTWKRNAGTFIITKAGYKNPKGFTENDLFLLHVHHETS